MDPPSPPEVIEAAGHLKYRDFLTVCVIVDHPDLFPDNWIYVHSPEVHMGRLQNFKNWSPHMVPDQAKTSLGAEYFVNENDALWNMADEDLVDLAAKELEVAEQSSTTAHSIMERSQARFDSGLTVESDLLTAKVRVAARQIRPSGKQFLDLRGAAVRAALEHRLFFSVLLGTPGARDGRRDRTSIDQRSPNY